jgi:hypothetical protein
MADCSDDELNKYIRMDDILMEYKELFKEAERVHSKRQDVVTYCRLQRRLNKLSLEWLSVDKKLKEACPVFYSNEWLQYGKEARDLFNHNKTLHQGAIDACVANGI